MLSYERLKAYSDNDFIKLREHLRMRRQVWTVGCTCLVLLAYMAVMPYPLTPWQFWGALLCFLVPTLLVLALAERIRAERGPAPADDLLEKKAWWQEVLRLAHSSAGAREVLTYAQERGRHIYGLDLAEMRRRRDEEEAERLAKVSEALQAPDIAPGEPNPLSAVALPAYLEHADKSDAQIEVLAKTDLKRYRLRMGLWVGVILAVAVALHPAINSVNMDPMTVELANVLLAFTYVCGILVIFGMLLCAAVGPDSQFHRILDPDVALKEVEELLNRSPGARAVRNAAAHAGRKLYRFDLLEMHHQREHEELESLRNPSARRPD